MRALPIRVPPITGESLESWLEAWAYRNHTCFGDLLRAVGLRTPGAQQRSGTWNMQLTPRDAAAVSMATGIDRSTVAAMTLDHYADRALRVNADTGAISRAFPWSRAQGSRFCPECLADSGGRWQLSWRLGWTFACTTHHCLLADGCPHCGAVPRRRPHVDELTPQPGYCAHPAVNSTGRGSARCGGALSTATVTRFAPNHPVLHAQRAINTIIESATTSFGIYRNTPVPRIAVLADIRAIAGRALAYATPTDLQRAMPDDLIAAQHDIYDHAAQRSGPARPESKPGLAAPARAATAALGAVYALHVLEQPDTATAGNVLRPIVISARDRGIAVSATNIGWGKGISPALAGSQLAALGPLLRPTDQLRYRIGTPVPSRPAAGVDYAAALASRLPSMLWPGWSLRFVIPRCQHRQLRHALSVAVLLVSSRRNLHNAAELVHSTIDAHAISRGLQQLRKHHSWTTIRAGIIAMHDHLKDSPPPIDYQRRRRLDYRNLLPDTTWEQVCRDTATPGVPPPHIRAARGFLYEQLTGSSAATTSGERARNTSRNDSDELVQYMTPELACALDEYAQAFLADKGIAGEPATWQPPTDLLETLPLPGIDPGTIDLTALHDAMSIPGTTPTAAARVLGTTTDIVCYLLATRPPPRAAATTSAGPARRNERYEQAKAALPREKFVDLYHHQRMPLRDIAASIGASRQMATRLAHDYDIAVREPHRPTRTIVEKDWLHEQYIIRRRVLPDIAKEAGMSTSTMGRWATRHGIPLRGRGGASQRAALATQSS